MGNLAPGTLKRGRKTKGETALFATVGRRTGGFSFIFKI
jgi:hypothetical protein